MGVYFVLISRIYTNFDSYTVIQAYEKDRYGHHPGLHPGLC